ncbi:MAG: NADH-quinone oxidoreductase subunit NuoN [Sphingomonadaceae bacterium]|nr:NADH-quinone oxidoreductase subunit NuoN [Sphingomonadaceae bacterium]
MIDVESSLATGAPEVVLAAGLLVLLLVGAFQGDRAADGISWGGVLLLVAAAVPLFDQEPARTLAWGGLYVADALSRYLKLLVFAGAAAALLVAMPALRRQAIARFEYPLLVLFATLGMALMVSAHDLLTLYLGLELMSLSCYVLAAFDRCDARSSEAGLKYFALGALASGVLLYGVSLVYGFVGATGFDAIAQAVRGEGRSLGVVAGLALVLAGLAFKISAVPFHMWTPDVYQGAPTPVTAFLATAAKVAAFGLLLRVVVGAFGALAADWRQIVVFLSLASMALGAVGAIGQTNAKRLMAYSAITHMGFALIGLAPGTAQGAQAVLLYLTVYLVMTFGAFLCLLSLVGPDGAAREELADLAGLARTRPGLAAALAIFMLSLAGLPPLFGFMPKLAVFAAAVEAGLWPLAVAGVLATVVAAFYYLRVVKLLYFDPPAGVGSAQVDEGVAPILMLAAASFSSPLGFLLLGPLSAAGQAVARALF